MNTNETLSTLSLAILGLLSKNSCSGYDLRKVFLNTPMGLFSSSTGAIYPALKRCEKNGWLRGDIDNSTTLRPRQVFHLTEEGRKLLKKELSQPVGIEDAIQRSGDLILRFAFMDGMLGDDEIITFLEEYASAMETYLETLGGIKTSMPLDTPRCGFLALEHGLHSYRANALWARRTLKGFQTDLKK